MEPVVLDTSVLVDLLRNDGRARALVASLGDDADVWGVTVTRAELLAGARLGDGPAITALLDTLHWIDVDPMLADLAGRMAAHFGRSHPGVGTVDPPLVRDHLGTDPSGDFVLISSELDGVSRTAWVGHKAVTDVRPAPAPGPDCSDAVAAERERVKAAALAAIEEL